MAIDTNLQNEFAKVKARTREEFESQKRLPRGNGLHGGHFMDAYIDRSEFKDELKEAYKSIFINKGEEFTQGYLAGRTGLVRNIFSTKYKAAQEAFSDL